MTEADWFSCEHPAPLFDHLGDRVSERKARLFALWCCRQCGCVLRDERLQAAVGVAARHTEGRVGDEARRSAEAAAWAAWDDLHFDELDDHLSLPARLLAVRYTPAEAVRDAARLATAAEFSESNPDGFDGLAVELAAEQAECVRELFGNPYRPVAADPGWLTPAVVAIAEGIYADRAFDRLPVLADALEDAGCDDSKILDHCRCGGPHVRGCWAVDLLLGKG